MHNSLINTNSNSMYRRAVSQQSEYKSKLFDEIAILMRANGDCDVHMQLKESIILVEKILIQQLKALIFEAIEVSNNPSPQLTDFEFLLHRNKPKLARFRNHMKNVQKIQCKSDQKQLGLDPTFLNRISSEESDEEQEIYDAEKTRRIYRADRISQILSPQKYDEFQKARSYTSNLRNKNNFLNKLVEVLQIPKELQENSPNFLDCLLFFALETVATLVDFSILTRLNSDNRINDPIIVPSNLSNDILHICPEVTQGRGQEGIKPIKVQEIQEAMRRVQQMHNHRKMGSSKIAFLAL
ncbi:hypothetical protein PVAND_010191 [Polypedilum vanderplanki]|uniref:Uncharacterized protein n=1 Tax=Polypedilum vanderplanki TaxID=319348 RepID=A0A9J6CF43_POLVA|nr:hypothetical protein PVAND_010191 [Polypedilum vanderplanki]